MRAQSKLNQMFQAWENGNDKVMNAFSFAFDEMKDGASHCFITSPTPSWLVGSVGRALQWYCRGHVFKSCWHRPEFFSGLIFTTA